MIGTGTQSDPYVLETATDLTSVSNDDTTWSSYFELANDIDMEDGSITPIGYRGNGFTGSFDGKGYVISNLNITYENRAGIFGSIGFYATIKNLGADNVNVTSDDSQIGVIVGANYSSTVENCFVKNSTVSGAGSQVGGIIGYGNNPKAINCNVLNVNVEGESEVGGFYGYAQSDDSSYFTENCYAVATVVKSTMTDSTYGGFVGSINTNSGYRHDFTDCYYDFEYFGEQKDGASGEDVSPKTTPEMQTQSTYSGWNFDEIWTINDGEYPTLQVFIDESTLPVQESVEVSTFIPSIESNTTKTKVTAKNTDTYINTIQSKSERHLKTTRSIMTYTSPIYSNATQSHRSVRTSDVGVQSWLFPIHSGTKRVAKGHINATSYIEKIVGSVNVPTQDIVVNATVSYIENPTNTVIQQNPTYTIVQENPSDVEVVK
ncbi:hypothetical protein [Salibacterium lacus]|uniref:GLUG domain-containing protein n=1 Tax=Salibacterium lacus TaxID=1898109 RepID=A0ABW5SWG4_9BACI